MPQSIYQRFGHRDLPQQETLVSGCVKRWKQGCNGSSVPFVHLSHFDKSIGSCRCLCSQQVLIFAEDKISTCKVCILLLSNNLFPSCTWVGMLKKRTEAEKQFNLTVLRVQQLGYPPLFFFLELERVPRLIVTYIVMKILWIYDEAAYKFNFLPLGVIRYPVDYLAYFWFYSRSLSSILEEEQG